MRQLLVGGLVLHAVGSSDQPVGADEGRAADVTMLFDVEADLPRKLPRFGILTANNPRGLPHALPTVCRRTKHQSRPACCSLR